MVKWRIMCDKYGARAIHDAPSPGKEWWNQAKPCRSFLWEFGDGIRHLLVQ